MGVQRIIVSAVLIFAILWPRLNYAITDILGGGPRTIVICSGDGLKRIALDQNGYPVSEGETVSDKCLNILAAVAFPPEDPDFTRIARVFALALPEAAHCPPTSAFARRANPPRAPPVV